MEELKEKDNEVFEQKLAQLPKHRQQLVENILCLMGKGEDDWKKTWRNAQGELRNYVTDRAYNGINVLMLTLLSIEANKSDCRFATFNQVQDKELKIKKGSKAFPIEYYSKIFNPKQKSFNVLHGVSQEEFNRVTAYMPFRHLSVGEQKEWKSVRSYQTAEMEEILQGSKMTNKEQTIWKNKYTYSLIKAYNVFIGDDIEGIEPLKLTENLTKDEMIAQQRKRLDRIIENYGKVVPIAEDGKNSAFYDTLSNSIHLPPRSSFFSMNDYYATALHEIAHSTGHKDKLARDFSKDQSAYAKEELRAEFASILLLKEFGADVLGEHADNTAKYLNVWGKDIKKNPSELFAAIKDADKIVKFVLEFEQNLELNQVKESEQTACTGRDDVPQNKVDVKKQTTIKTNAKKKTQEELTL